MCNQLILYYPPLMLTMRKGRNPSIAARWDAAGDDIPRKDQGFQAAMAKPKIVRRNNIFFLLFSSISAIVKTKKTVPGPLVRAPDE